MSATAPSRARPLSPPTRTQILGANLARVRARIDGAARAAGRDPAAVHLLGVTKSVDAATAADLVRLGVRDLGENRVDRLEAMRADLAAELGAAQTPRWHMIGHLQRNKARRAASCADVVQSVDSEKLLATLERLAAELERTLEVFLEIDLTGIETRSGFSRGAVRALLDSPTELGRLRLRGLMTMAAPDPNTEAGELATQAAARRTFAELRELAESLPRERFVGGRVELSMGMSDDLDAAVAEGADLVRVGSALFEGLAATSSTRDGGA